MELLLVQKNIFVRNGFLKNICTFFDLQIFSKSFWNFSQKTSAGLSKFLFTSTEEHFGDCFLEKWNFFSSLWDFIRKKTSYTWRNFSAGWSEPHLTSPAERFEDFLRKLYFSSSVSDFISKKYPTFSRKNSANFSKLQFGCPSKHSLKKRPFWKK